MLLYNPATDSQKYTSRSNFVNRMEDTQDVKEEVFDIKHIDEEDPHYESESRVSKVEAEESSLEGDSAAIANAQSHTSSDTCTSDFVFNVHNVKTEVVEDSSYMSHEVGRNFEDTNGEHVEEAMEPSVAALAWNLNFARDCNVQPTEDIMSMLSEYFDMGNAQEEAEPGDLKDPGPSISTFSESQLYSGMTGDDDSFLEEDSVSPLFGTRNDGVYVSKETEESNRRAVYDYFSSNCCAAAEKMGCVKQFGIEEIISSRLQMSVLSEDQKDWLILGMFSAFKLNTDQETKRSRQKSQKARERTRFQEFSIDGKTVCRKAFLLLLGISPNKFTALKAHFVNNGREVRMKRAGGKTKFAVTVEDTVDVTMFLQNYSEDHAICLPGRMPGFKDRNVMALPSSTTIEGVYKVYMEAATIAGKRLIPVTIFRRIWKTHLPFIIVGRPTTDLCWTCKKNNNLVLNSANLYDELKLQTLELQRNHLLKVREMQRHYRRETSAAKDVVDTHQVRGLGRAEGIEWMHYSFDFAQSVHIPSSPLQAGPLYFLNPRKCHIFGICCEGFPKQVNYLIDEGMLVSKGSTAVISYLHHFFDAYGLGEKAVSLHCDNCSQNKNRLLIAYLAWRVMVGLHQNIKLNFMVAGHRKFAPQLCFGMLKRRFQYTEVHCLADMARVVTESSDINIAQLVGKESGDNFVPTLDWQGFLGGFSAIPGMEKMHFFEFDAKEPGIVCHSERHGEPLSRTRILSVDPPKGFPKTLPVPGLSTERKQYLFNQIRQFVAEEKQNITCPAQYLVT